MHLKRVLGTEPALITGAVQAVLAVVVASTPTFTDEAAGVVMLVVSAITGAAATWATADSRLTAVVEVVKAFLVAITFFEIGSLSFDPEQQAAIVAAVIALGTVFVRANTVPVPTAISEPTLATEHGLAPGPEDEVLDDGEWYDDEPDFADDEQPDEPGERRAEG